MQASPGWGAVPGAVAHDETGMYYAADEVLTRLTDRGLEHEQVGEAKWKAQCPVHANAGSDLNFEMAYGDTNPDALLLSCWVCGDAAALDDFAAALDLEVSDLFNRDGQDDAAEEPSAPLYEPPKVKREKTAAENTQPTLVATYSYRATSGEELYQWRRFEPGFNAERKAKYPRRPDGHGGWIKKEVFKGSDAPPHIPYNAPELYQAALHADSVIVTEGEKAADRLMQEGFTATTLDGGAGAEWTPFVVGHFAGVSAVRLFMDDDDAGAQWVRNALAALSPAVPVITVHKSATGMAGDDVVDHLDSGHTLDDMVELPLASFRAPEEEWPDAPMPLEKRKTPAFPTHLLGPYEEMATAVATSLQAPIEYAAGCALGAAGAALGGQVQVDLGDGWTELHTALYLAMAGPSGDGKSPTLRAMFKELMHLAMTYQKAVAPFLSELTETDGKGKPLPGAERFEPPTMFSTNVTPESATILTAHNQNRLNIFTTEETIFKIASGIYGKGPGSAAIDIFLNGYSGDPVIRHRVKDETPCYIPAAKLSMTLLMQTGLLRGLEKKNPEFRGNGFLARFLYLVANERTIPYVKKPGAVPDDAVKRYNELIRGLYETFWLSGLPYTLTPVGGLHWSHPFTHASIDRQVPEARTLTLPASVDDAFHDFATDLANRRLPGGDLHDIADWARKRAGDAGRIAAIMTLSEDRDATELSTGAVRNAVELMPYLVAQGRSAFWLMSRSGSDNEPAIRVREAIKRRTRYGEVFTLRSVHQWVRDQSWCETAEDTRAALRTLTNYEHVREVKVSTGKAGRPSERFVAHPETYGIFAKREKHYNAPLHAEEGVLSSFERHFGGDVGSDTHDTPRSAGPNVVPNPPLKTTQNPNVDVVEDVVDLAPHEPEPVVVNGLADLLDLPVTPEGGTFADADHFAYEGRSGCIKHPAEHTRIVSTLLPAAPRASTRRTPNPEEPTHGTGCPQCVRDLIAAEQESAGDDVPDGTALSTEPLPATPSSAEAPGSLATLKRHTADPEIPAPWWPAKTAPAWMVRANDLYTEGRTVREIAAEVGAHFTGVGRWIDPDIKRKRGGSRKKEAQP
ncbi:DUF3987 domain-containing protein [Streptomyces sp. NPDC005180]|uniref:DUF3987 domain-containing protein n=1 Tax=Streptomyces sp. NPDC005180 TaxID=3156868 RepID=UPI0033A49ABC